MLKFQVFYWSNMYAHKSESISRTETTLRQSLFWHGSTFDTIPFVVLHITDGKRQRIYSLDWDWQISNSCASFPGALRKECFQAGHKCHNRHDTTVNWYSESRWKHSWALINIKLSSSQSCRAIQWVAIKSFVLQFLYEGHENMTFYSCYSNLILIYGCTLWTVIRSINYVCSCGQVFTYTHRGDECHGNLGFFIDFFCSFTSLELLYDIHLWWIWKKGLGLDFIESTQGQNYAYRLKSICIHSLFNLLIYNVF